MRSAHGVTGPAGGAPALLHGERRLALARRVAEAHRGIDDATLLSFVSGSVVEGLADERSDIDMSVVFEQLPDPAVLEAACVRAGGTPWFWRAGEAGEGGFVVAFHVDDAGIGRIEVQIGYADHATLGSQVDELLVKHNPDTPLHKLAEGMLKAQSLAEPTNGRPTLAAHQARLAVFPPGLAHAMVAFWAQGPTPWRAITQLMHRDAGLWLRELLVEASYRLLGMLAGLNRRWFTRFQVKRGGRFAASLAIAPPRLAERLEAMLQAPPAEAMRELNRLEREVFALVARHRPEVDIAAAVRRLGDWRDPAGAADPGGAVARRTPP